jgi:CRISPR-associated protein Cmr2
MSWDIFADTGAAFPFFRRLERNDRGEPELGCTHHGDLTPNRLGLTAQPPPAGLLPAGSYFRSVEFTLRRPFTSRDIPSYYPFENALCRDPVLRVPMLPGSSWKGGLRGAAIDNLIEAIEAGTLTVTQGREARIRLWRLFGNEKGQDYKGYGKEERGNVIAFLNEKLGGDKSEEVRALRRELCGEEGGDLGEAFRKGRIHCYPTFFVIPRIELAVLNPRDGRTRAGTHPIFIETIPAGATASLCWLYHPFDLQEKEAEERKREANRDWEVLRDAIDTMFRLNGFGAKKTSGFGRASFKTGAPPYPEVRA